MITDAFAVVLEIPNIKNRKFPALTSETGRVSMTSFIVIFFVTFKNNGSMTRDAIVRRIAPMDSGSRVLRSVLAATPDEDQKTEAIINPIRALRRVDIDSL